MAARPPPRSFIKLFPVDGRSSGEAAGLPASWLIADRLAAPTRTSCGRARRSSKLPAHVSTRSNRADEALAWSYHHLDPGGKSMRDSKMLLLLAAAVALIPGARGRGDGNLLDDPSFEVSKSKDQFGLVFARWGGWKYEGDCDFRVGEVARTGKHSCLLHGGIGAKIRVPQNVELSPGRYRVTAYLRGLDIGRGTYNATTEFMFDGKYQQLNKNGTFGWTKLTYVGEIEEKKQAGPSFGLMAPGYFWIDDVSLEKVGDDVPLTKAPVLGNEEAPIAPPGEIVRTAVRCSECGYRNNPDGGTCYACGAALSARTPDVEGPAVKLLASFEDRNPMSGGTVVGAHATLRP